MAFIVCMGKMYPNRDGILSQRVKKIKNIDEIERLENLSNLKHLDLSLKSLSKNQKSNIKVKKYEIE